MGMVKDSLFDVLETVLASLERGYLKFWESLAKQGIGRT
jgi:hypothetical protein